MSQGIAAVLLAGGAGSRMGGTVPKPLTVLAGRTLAERALDTVRGHCDPIVVSAPDPAAYRALALPVVPDRRTERLGPLAGLEAAALWLCALRAPVTTLLCVPGDTPFLPPDLGSRLAEGLAGRPRVAQFAGRLHPTVALWPLACLEALPAFLDDAAGGRSIRAFLERTGFDAVPFAPLETAPGGDPFFNVNTPGDLTEAERHFRR